MVIYHGTIDPYATTSSVQECRSCGARFTSADGHCQTCGSTAVQNIAVTRE
ncbi:DUF7129 domain-containing putative zinc-binding protein [Haloquadratum walsbyi]|uniref:Small CPxCG-related zinc finger protein n=2 Tax=Haloquadratum walsbyi TaxID=293091 RepID=J7RFW0_HALWD|nr:small CPxCG-related zinc finger protein [Haloquadratum walsbyi C23]CCL97844.1 small CPxCG-related zinc finger protein [Haloquadratum walsbyi DSM 16790]